MMNLSLYSAYVSSLSVLVPAIFLIWKRRVLTDRVMQLLGMLLVTGGIADLLSFLMPAIWKTSQNAVINCFFLLGFLIGSLLFVEICSPLKKTASFIALGYCVLTALNTVYLQSFATLQTYGAALQDAIFIFYTFFFFHYLLKQPVCVSLLHYPAFWVVTGVFFYSILSLYLFVLANYVFVNLPKEYGMVLWMFHNCANMLENALFATAICYAGRKTAPSTRMIRKY